MSYHPLTSFCSTSVLDFQHANLVSSKSTITETTPICGSGDEKPHELKEIFKNSGTDLLKKVLQIRFANEFSESHDGEDICKNSSNSIAEEFHQNLCSAIYSSNFENHILCSILNLDVNEITSTESDFSEDYTGEFQKSYEQPKVCDLFSANTISKEKIVLSSSRSESETGESSAHANQPVTVLFYISNNERPVLDSVESQLHNDASSVRGRHASQMNYKHIHKGTEYGQEIYISVSMGENVPPPTVYSVHSWIAPDTILYSADSVKVSTCNHTNMLDNSMNADFFVGQKNVLQQLNIAENKNTEEERKNNGEKFLENSFNISNLYIEEQDERHEIYSKSCPDIEEITSVSDNLHAERQQTYNSPLETSRELSITEFGLETHSFGNEVERNLRKSMDIKLNSGRSNLQQPQNVTQNENSTEDRKNYEEKLHESSFNICNLSIAKQDVQYGNSNKFDLGIKATNFGLENYPSAEKETRNFVNLLIHSIFKIADNLEVKNEKSVDFSENCKESFPFINCHTINETPFPPLQGIPRTLKSTLPLELRKPLLAISCNEKQSDGSFVQMPSRSTPAETEAFGFDHSIETRSGSTELSSLNTNRTVLSDHQKKILSEFLGCNQYSRSYEYKDLSKLLSMRKNIIMNWFNRSQDNNVQTGKYEFRRRKSMITPKQLDFLCKQYLITKCPEGKEIENIALKLGLERKVVHTWFNNRRFKEQNLLKQSV